MVAACGVASVFVFGENSGVFSSVGRATRSFVSRRTFRAPAISFFCLTVIKIIDTGRYFVHSWVDLNVLSNSVVKRKVSYNEFLWLGPNYLFVYM